MGHCDPGLKGERTMTVRRADTAEKMGSGDVPVLGTPALLALAEAACVDAILDDLPEGQTSVGVWAEVEHDLPSPVGARITAEGTLTGHHGRRLEFRVLVRQDDEVVGRVRHRRVLVDRARFLSKVNVAANGRSKQVQARAS